MIYFTIESDGLFLKTNNLLGMLRYMSTLAIIGLGLTAVLIVGEIDLSFASLYGLSAMIAAVAWIEWEWPVWWAIVAAVCRGLCRRIVQRLLHGGRQDTFVRGDARIEHVDPWVHPVRQRVESLRPT